MSQRVLVLAAHPDDEPLGCGAALRRHRDQGDAVFVLTLTDGLSSRGAVAADAATRRMRAADAAEVVLGFEWVYRGSFPDNALDTVPLLALTRAIEDVCSRLKPTLASTHRGGDLNVVHLLTQRAALTALRPVPGASCREIRGFEIPSSTEWGSGLSGSAFQPTLHVDVPAQAPHKRAALAAYADEMRPAPHARSLEAIDALMTLRGTQVGVAKAEAFVLLRKLEA